MIIKNSNFRFTSFHFLFLIIALFSLCISNVLNVHGFIVEVDDQYETEDAWWAYVTSGVYSPGEIVGSNTPYIDINLKGDVNNFKGNTTLYAVLYGYGDEGLFGEYIDGEYKICNNGNLLVEENGNPEKNFFVERFQLPGNIVYRETISKAGFYSLFLIKCKQQDQTLSLNGDITFLNPYGHLRGEHYGFLPLFGCLLAIYGIYSLVWIALCLLFRKDIMKLQLLLGSILILAVVENAMLTAEYAYRNDSGYSPIPFFVVTSLITLIRQACSRMILLTVALGYGVARASLKNKEKIFMAIYFVIYLVTFIFYHIGQVLYSQRVISDFLFSTVFTLPSAFADAGLYVWIFISVWNTITSLAKKKQTQKIRMYKILFYTLVIYFIASAVWTVIQLIVASTELIYVLWRGIWLVDGFWYLSFLCVFTIVLFVWRPNPNNKRYAYSEQVDTEDPQGEELPERNDEHNTSEGSDEDQR
eukprot:gb/GECH01004289.1/.p1 GENE.gb/GECH01004289.1/~~gb/GECH01004289.1/.p1  ORF type:complete len:473 (+),score=81.08 gb/GECH01004289.1/:1-1419(+)